MLHFPQKKALFSNTFFREINNKKVFHLATKLPQQQSYIMFLPVFTNFDSTTIYVIQFKLYFFLIYTAIKQTYTFPVHIRKSEQFQDDKRFNSL